MVCALALAVWIVPGAPAFARGGHGGGGHGGGGHGGGHHSGGHRSGGYHYGGRYYGGYRHYGGYGYGYRPRYYYYPNVYLNWGSYYGYPGYGYGYGYNSGYGYPYPYTDYGYGYGYAPADVVPGPTAPASTVGAALPPGRYLGVDEQPVVDGGGAGMQVVGIYPGSPAQQAGLQVGDVIHSANGYLTQQHGNLTWIIANAAPNGVLQLNVRSARDGANHVITARVP
jgi:hypothetical protein